MDVISAKYHTQYIHVVHCIHSVLIYTRTVHYQDN